MSGTSWSTSSLGSSRPAVWAPVVPPECNVLWHYTNSAGLIGIVSGGPAIRATHYRFLNDTEELEFGFRMLTDLWDDQSAQLAPDQDLRDMVESAIAYARSSTTGRELYVACASLARDSLAQWRGYAGGNGYAIGFRAHQDMHVERVSPPLAREEPDMETIGPPHSFDMRIPPTWRQVVYDRLGQQSLLLGVLEYVVADIRKSGIACDVAESLAEYMITNLLYVKHPAFSEEEEVRAVTAANPKFRRQFRESAYGATPFVTFIGRTEKILLPDMRTQDQIACSGLDIVEVMVGPCSDMEAAELGAELLLENQKISSAVVSRSDAPFRQ